MGTYTFKYYLKQFNKAISVKVLEEWIKKSQEFLSVKGAIQSFEFLFLVANTVNRKNYFNRIPKLPLDISRDEKVIYIYSIFEFKLFNVDSSGFQTIKNPDTKIQHYMNY
jgi:hypothetical protein